MKPSLYKTSKYAGKRQYEAEPPYETGYFEHDFGTYKLEARVAFNKSGDWPSVLAIHGARSDYSKLDVLVFKLIEQGVSVLSIAMSGHSNISPLKNEETSLGRNICEAEAFFAYLAPDKPATVIASSLGGTPALKLLDQHQDHINKFVLIYPGIYATEAYDVLYGESFANILHRPFSYRQNDTIALLEEFEGRVMLIKGEYDGLSPEAYDKPAGTAVGEHVIDGQPRYSPIPKDVFDLISNTMAPDRLERVEIAGADHGTGWLREHPDEAARLAEKMALFIKN